MPNDSRSRRDKNEKEKKRKARTRKTDKKNPKPLYKKPAAEDLDSSSSSSAAEEAGTLFLSLAAESEVAGNKALSNEALETFSPLLPLCLLQQNQKSLQRRTGASFFPPSVTGKVVTPLIGAKRYPLPLLGLSRRVNS
jgi:hypothetical protein